MSPLRTWVTAVLVTCSQPLSFLIHCMGFFSSNFHPSVQRVVCCKCCIGPPFQHTHHRTEMPKIYPSRSLPSDLEANGMDHHVRVLGPCMSWEEPGVTTEKPDWGHGILSVSDWLCGCVDWDSESYSLNIPTIIYSGQWFHNTQVHTKQRSQPSSEICKEPFSSTAPLEMNKGP